MLNEPTKTCIVQSFVLSGAILEDVIQEVDVSVMAFIDRYQQDWWYIQNIQHSIDAEHSTYIVHLVMSRMHDADPKQY